MNIIPFEGGNVAAPARAKNFMKINGDVHTAAAFGSISIKGKVFALVKDGVRKQLTKMDEDGETVPVSYISIAILRANTKTRVFYADAYDEDKSDGAKPTCFSHDGVAPDASAAAPQANKCALCPHAVWGATETGKGTECSPNARLAVAAPDKLSEPMLLRVPPASIRAFKDAVKLGEARQLPYNALVMRVGFVSEAATPKLTFKPVGVLDDNSYDKATVMYEDETVLAIVGTASAAAAPALPAPEANVADELDAALAARQATAKASAATKTAKVAEDLKDVLADKPKPKAKPAPVAEVEDDEPVAEQPKPKAKPKVEDSGSSLLSDLDALLGSSDD